MIEVLNLRKLKVLVAVSKTGSATEAGKQLHLGQSAISQTIKELQEDTGLVLFERVGRGLLATPEGKALALEGEAVLAALKRVNRHAKALRLGEQDSIAVGVMTAFIHGEVARCVAHYSAQRPRLSLRLESFTKEDLIKRVARGDIDLALVIGGVLEPELCTFASIAMRVVCIVPKAHPLSGSPSVDINTLMQYRSIRLTKESPLRIALEALGIHLFDASSPEQGVLEVSTQRAMVTMVEAGAGIALVDPLVLSAEDQVDVLPFEPAVHVNLSLFARKGWEQQAFINELAIGLYAALKPLAASSHFYSEGTLTI